MLLSGDREEAVAIVAKTVGIDSEFINASLTPQQKSGCISKLQDSGHTVAMVIIFNKSSKFPHFEVQKILCIAIRIDA